MINNEETTLKDYTFSDLKALLDFLEIRKSIIEENGDSFDREDIDAVINMQNIVWKELHNRANAIKELKENKPVI